MGGLILQYRRQGNDDKREVMTIARAAASATYSRGVDVAVVLPDNLLEYAASTEARLFSRDVSFAMDPGSIPTIEKLLRVGAKGTLISNAAVQGHDLPFVISNMRDSRLEIFVGAATGGDARTRTRMNPTGVVIERPKAYRLVSEQENAHVHHMQAAIRSTGFGGTIASAVGIKNAADIRYATTAGIDSFVIETSDIPQENLRESIFELARAAGG